MEGFPPQTARSNTTPSRPAWRHLVIIGLVAGLLVLLFVWLTAVDNSEPQIAPMTWDQWPAANTAANVAATVATPVAPPPMAPQVEAPGVTFIAKLNLRPRLRNGRVNGYVVRPDDPSILAGTPLRPGDVLLEVDGLKLDAARAALLAQSAGEYQDVFVRLERGNEELEGVLPLGTP